MKQTWRIWVSISFQISMHILWEMLYIIIISQNTLSHYVIMTNKEFTTPIIAITAHLTNGTINLITFGKQFLLIPGFEIWLFLVSLNATIGNYQMQILVLCLVAYKQLRSLFSVHQNTVWRVHSMFLYIARLPENSLCCCDEILCRVLSSSHKETCSWQQTDLTHNATHNACRTAWHFDENGSLLH